jgi:Ca2+-binding EF-hand superfamily protein
LHNLSVQDVRDVRGLFMSIDTDGGSEIDASELKALLESLGRSISGNFQLPGQRN